MEKGCFRFTNSNVRSLMTFTARNTKKKVKLRIERRWLINRLYHVPMCVCMPIQENLKGVSHPSLYHFGVLLCSVMLVVSFTNRTNLDTVSLFLILSVSSISSVRKPTFSTHFIDGVIFNCNRYSICGKYEFIFLFCCESPLSLSLYHCVCVASSM